MLTKRPANSSSLAPHIRQVLRQIIVSVNFLLISVQELGSLPLNEFINNLDRLGFLNTKRGAASNEPSFLRKDWAAPRLRNRDALASVAATFLPGTLHYRVYHFAGGEPCSAGGTAKHEQWLAATSFIRKWSEN